MRGTQSRRLHHMPSKLLVAGLRLSFQVQLASTRRLFRPLFPLPIFPTRLHHEVCALLVRKTERGDGNLINQVALKTGERTKDVALIFELPVNVQASVMIGRCASFIGRMGLVRHARGGGKACDGGVRPCSHVRF